MIAGSPIDLLTQPHHDTGPAYLRGRRSPGARLTARLWVPAPRAPEQVVLRQVVDGEPAISLLEPTDTSRAGTWWEGGVHLVNPVNRYRFLLLEPSSPTPYLWCHAAGVSDHDVPDATDFQILTHDEAPTWVADAIAYQIFPDRFAAHTDPADRERPRWARPHAWLDEPPQTRESAHAWYGGDLDGIADHLDYIAELGADIIYLTPVFPAGSTHRYDSTTFAHVDELLGGDEALARLSQAIHARGMRLILDLTTNHTGATHEWFTAAQADASCPETHFYTFTSHPDQYEAWLDVPSLPRLDHRSSELRARLLRGPDSVTAHWLQPPYSADGWRTDVANMTGRRGMVDLAHQVAADMRATMRQVEQATGRRLWLVAEHGHDASADLTGPGWQGTMNYAGFTRPLWAWLSNPDPADGLTWLGIPTPLPHLNGDAIVRGVRQYTAQMPATSLLRSMNLLCSHDTPRTRTALGSRQAHLVAATALFTAPGVPTVFAGDELGATGRNGEHSRTTIPWQRDESGHELPHVGATGSWGPVDHGTLARYRRLAAMRRKLPALRRGGLRFVHAEADLVIWVRTHPDGDVLVALARDAADAVRLPLHLLPAAGVEDIEVFDGAHGRVTGSDDAQPCLVIGAHAPGSVVVRLRPGP